MYTYIREKLVERRLLLYPMVGLGACMALAYISFVGVGSQRRESSELSEMGFVRREGAQLIVNGSPFYVNGWNSYWLMTQSAEERSGTLMKRMFETAAAMGLTVCRTWAFNDGADRNALQLSPGKFDARVFEALDKVIAEAQRHGIKLLLSLSNEWSDFGGKRRYVKWAKEAGVSSSTSNDSFFFDPSIRGYFKNYLKTVLLRRNHITGIEYRDDPTIFAWELMNEPRCPSDPSGNTIQYWIEEMASFVKSIDKKHLLTVGLEGFYGPSASERLRFNPTEDSNNLGCDFIRNFKVPDIDFASVHIYPDFWLPANTSLQEKKRFVSNWVSSHIKDGEEVLNKPVLFTEFGLSIKNNISHRHQDDFYKHVFDLIYVSALNRGAGAGSFIWQLLLEGMDRLGDEFGIVPKRRPLLFWLLKGQSCRLSEVSNVHNRPWYRSYFQSKKEWAWRSSEGYC